MPQDSSFWCLGQLNSNKLLSVQAATTVLSNAYTWKYHRIKYTYNSYPLPESLTLT